MAIKGDAQLDVSPTRAGIELGRTRGFSEAITMLRLMAEPIEPTRDIGPPTYTEPQKEEELHRA